MNPNAHITDVAIYREPTLALARLNVDGIGGTCNQALSRAANTLGDKVGRVAHRMGKGPEAAMDRILKNLKTKDRGALLKEWYQSQKGDDIFPGLEGYLHTLLKYALPKETIETQITAFVAIASLIPQYPPLRSTCLRYKKFKELTDPKEAALSLWKREHAPSDPRWDGFYQITAACLSDDISRILETIPVERWGKVSVSQLGVIDQLLAKISSERLEALDYVAIRYLAGILQLSTFWEHGNYKRHQATAKVLLQRLLHCIKETGIEHKGKEELFCDREGIDLLVDVTLHGIQRWLESIPERKVRRRQCWFNNLQKLLEPLSRPEAKVLLPLSWQRTKENLQMYCKERWIIGWSGVESTTHNVCKGNKKGAPSERDSTISNSANLRQETPTYGVLENEYHIRSEITDRMAPYLGDVQKKMERWLEENPLGRVHAKSNPLIGGLATIFKEPSALTQHSGDREEENQGPQGLTSPPSQNVLQWPPPPLPSSFSAMVHPMFDPPQPYRLRPSPADESDDVVHHGRVYPRTPFANRRALYPTASEIDDDHHSDVIIPALPPRSSVVATNKRDSVSTPIWSIHGGHPSFDYDRPNPSDSRPYSRSSSFSSVRAVKGDNASHMNTPLQQSFIDHEYPNPKHKHSNRARLELRNNPPIGVTLFGDRGSPVITPENTVLTATTKSTTASPTPSSSQQPDSLSHRANHGHSQP